MIIGNEIATKHSARRKVKLPRWIIPELRPLVHEAAARGGLQRVQTLVFLKGAGGRVNAVHAIRFADDPWPAGVYQNGGSLLLIFERRREACELHAAFNALIGGARRIALEIMPAGGSA